MRRVIALALFVLFSNPAVAKSTEKASEMIPVGDFTDEVIAPVRAEIEKMVKKGEKQIVLEIDSHGGSVDTGWQFVSFLEEQKKKGVRISCFVDWKALSMGAYLLEAGCDDRWAAPQAEILFHEGKIGIDSGRVDEIRKVADRLDQINKGIIKVTAKRMGMSEKEFSDKIHEGDWSIGTDEAMRLHALDAVRTNMEMPPLATLAPPADGGLMELLRRLGGISKINIGI